MGLRRWRTFRERRWRALLSPYLDGELPAAQVRRLEEHLAACPSCRQELEELRATVALLRALPQVAAPRSFALPATTAARVAREAIRRPPPRLLQLSGAAAALLFVGLLAADLATLGGGAPPEPLAERALQAPAPEGYAAEAATAEAAAEEAPEDEALEEAPAAAPTEEAGDLTPTSQAEQAAPAVTPAVTEEPAPAKAAPAPTREGNGRLALRITEGMVGGLALVLVGGGLYLWRRGTRSHRPPS